MVCLQKNKKKIALIQLLINISILQTLPKRIFTLDDDSFELYSENENDGFEETTLENISEIQELEVKNTQESQKSDDNQNFKNSQDNQNTNSNESQESNIEKD